ncbi:MAG TPA: M23 family metallopeptidase [Gemmatirosa sp.]|nr:M23 family metallopeptidase [Gemmatirosa sp.]
MAAPRRPRRRRIGLATYLVVGAAAAAVTYWAPTAPEPARRAQPLALAAVDTLAAMAAVPARATVPVWESRTDTLGRGETMATVLERAGLARPEAARALRAVGGLQPRTLRAGLAVTTGRMSSDTAPQEITFQPSVDRVVRLRFLEGAWMAAVERLAWRTDTIAARGAITASVYQTVHRAIGDRLPAAERSELVWRLADILEYRVDLGEDVQPGDSVQLLVERRVAPDGSPREGRIVAAALTVDGTPIEAIRFRGRGAREEYYDQHGKSLRAAFLRAPLEFRRISSAFGMRRHPILGRVKMHRGTDYAASSGTPVRAIGDGVVVRAGWAGGYGNVLEIRHRNGFVTRYGHLRGFARGVRPGRSVGIGETVAFVGTTGLSTAPHLHFEVLVGGAQRDPRVALRDKTGWPLSRGERGAFDALRRRLHASLSAPTPEPPARVATAD